MPGISFMAYPGNLTESIREIGDVFTTSLGKRNLMTSLKLTASSRRNVWLILVSCCFTKQMISRPGCKAFEYVKKNGLSRFLQKSQTQHRPRPPDSGLRNPQSMDIWHFLWVSWLHSETSHHQPSLWTKAHHPCGNQQGRELPGSGHETTLSSLHQLQVPVADVLSPGFQAVLSVKDSAVAVTIPDCNMINMIIIYYNMT